MPLLCALLLLSLVIASSAEAQPSAPLTPAPAPGVQAPLSYTGTGEATPQGFHYEQRRRTGMVISGAALFGGAWLGTMALALPLCDGDGVCLRATIPFVGPPMMMKYLMRHSHSGVEMFYLAPLFLDSMMQITGAVLFIVGLVKPKRVLVRDTEGPVVEPIVGLSSLGLRLRF